MLSAEELFVKRYEELKSGLPIRDDFNLLKVAAALRQLLIDEQPLVVTANRNRRLKIRYVINNVGSIKDFPVTPEYIFHGDGLYPNIAKTNLGKLKLNRDQFLSVPIFEAPAWNVTVRDIIKFVANKYGGVHFDSTRTDEETVIEKVVQQMISLIGVDYVSIAINTISRITLEALHPLRKAIGYRQGPTLGGELKCEIKQGWSWHGVLRIRPQEEYGEHIFYELGNIDGSPPRFTLLIDASGDLVGRIQINHEIISEVHARGFCRNDYFNNFIYLLVEVRYGDIIEISLSINNELLSKERVKTAITPKTISQQSIGTDLNGDNSATFDLVEFFIVGDVLDDENRRNALEYFNRKYGLNI